MTTGHESSEFIVAVDIGGTFTDCVVLESTAGLTVGKAFSTPPDFSVGIMDAIGVCAEQLNSATPSVLAQTRLFLHSTTVAENALVQRTLAKAAVITTRGHEDTLRAMRGGYGRWSGLTDDEKRNVVETDKPEPIVPRELVYGIKERTDSRGAVIVGADDEEIEEVILAARKEGVEALGICLLWSFANPTHERRIEDIAKRVAPELFITLSANISPTIGEYERMSTVALNVRLGPAAKAYLERLESRLAELGADPRILIMQAYGGLLPLEKAVSRPVGLVESGPVSGLVGAAAKGEALGFGDIIAADMGGTTFKAGVVRDGSIEYQREPMVLRYHYALPKMDVVSLGLAGGSIVQVDGETRLPRVGPRSAGSYPGPICYDHGGEEPTVTDVDAILGYLNPRMFAGGRAELNIEKAVDLFTRQIAGPLGMETAQAAAAIYRLVNSMLFDLLHKATVQRGIDPRRFALFSFGGTAGMHVSSYAAELGADPIVIPFTASVQGAYGLAVSDVVHEEQVTQPMQLPVDPAELSDLFARLRGDLQEELRDDGFADRDIVLEPSIDVSYRRQVHVLTVPVELDGKDGGELSEEEIANVVNRFESMYRNKYGPGAGYREAGIEFVAFRVRGRGLVPKIEPAVEKRTTEDASAAIVETRQAWVDETQQVDEVPGYDFERLRYGHSLNGPAIIWSPITTVVVRPSQRVEVDREKNLLIWNGNAGGGPS